ncbi:hypothetical protein C5167_003609 [Papaver somniferum]|uniref:acetyl-CoA carboxytransferase n=1 Tax=Papaver somniferum TaxID=3469 RepID=A0A4Y7L424_PAPSO|nr:acetyl-coenzyme A carboxylase carboxyl transferase subunit alpha, chloroplastic-like [Papaver somniferum]RZC79390.1 hypothetical protein C5167_003609 [Papaver somniferum]
MATTIPNSLLKYSGTSSISDLLQSSSNGVNGVPLKSLGKTTRLGSSSLIRRRDLSVSALIKKGKKKDEHPWPEDADPNVKGGVLSHLSHFKPLKTKPKPVTLDFERPLMDLEKKIIDVRKMAQETGLDFSDQIIMLQNKYEQALKDLYTHLTPIQRVNIARHPNRPTFLDHVINITDKWVELHGDRAGYDDPAIVTGLGTIDGQRYMFIGQQKGRNTKENIQRNFGMPTPHGYRKALRMMYYADHHGFPIITFIDTPGAYADLRSEELGQGEAIAYNLRTMFGLKVPIVSIVIGEGGSGGALAIGCANKLLMMENAVFFVASPEACAAILWKSAKASPKAAEKLKITAPELCKLGICDGIIPEPLGGAHADSAWTSQQIKIAITEAMAELKKMDIPELLNHRMLKFRSLGGFQEGLPVEPEKKVNMKQKEEPIIQREEISKSSDIELEGEVEKLREQIMKARESSTELPKLGIDEMIEKLKREVDQEYAEAAKAMGLTDSLNKLRDEFLKSRKSSEQAMDPSLVEKIEKLKADFNLGLSEAPNYASLTYKLDMLKEISKAKKLSEQNEKAMTLKQEFNKRFKEVMNRADVKKKIEALEADIASARGSKDEALVKALKEKIVKVKKEVEFELADVLKSLRLDVDVVKSKTKALNEQIPLPDIKYRIDELNEDINEGIEEAISSTDLKNKIELLKLEMVKAGKTPDAETKNKIDALKQQIKQKLAEVLASSSLVEKHANLKEEIAQAVENSGDSDESILKEDLRYGDSGVGIAAGRIYS